MPQRKKAGCTYANVSDDYMLYKQAVTQPTTVSTKTGGVRRRHGGNTDTPQGMQDAMNIVTGLGSQVTGSLKSATGMGGCAPCRSSRRGGAIELAPFAASLAFLAARMSMDDKLNFTRLLNMNSAQGSVPRKTSTRRSASVRM